MDPRGTVGRIFKEDHYTLLHTKYESSRPCGFGEEDVFPILSLWELMTPGAGRGGAIYTPARAIVLHLRVLGEYYVRKANCAHLRVTCVHLRVTYLINIHKQR